jgi:hypothetical protein
MIIIRYGNFILNGTDMSGKEALATEAEAHKLVRLGYAEFIQETVQESVKEHTPIWPQETKRIRGKKRGFKT